MFDATLQTLSVKARGVLGRIGKGQVLRVPDDGSQPYLVNTHFSRGETLQEIKVSSEVVAELVASGLMHALAPEPVGQRKGWKELGVYGYGCKIYCLVQ